MKKQFQILGRIAPNPKLTVSAAFALASILSVPVFIVLSLADWLFL
ncbi:hypothetical protein [Phaeobacter sp. 11ANDIMAR09]|nr:hypothetical protein [Phaeobacter sp. 11ANDIMAR09]